jgi:hypothetical protein
MNEYYVLVGVLVVVFLIFNIAAIWLTIIISRGK